jgi:hypothetical protein
MDGVIREAAQQISTATNHLADFEQIEAVRVIRVRRLSPERIGDRRDLRLGVVADLRDLRGARRAREERGVKARRPELRSF